jgi:hypothetical protein
LEGIRRFNELAGARLERSGLLGGKAFQEKPCVPGCSAPLGDFGGVDAKLGSKGGLRVGAIVNEARDSGDGVFLCHDGFPGLLG